MYVNVSSPRFILRAAKPADRDEAGEIIEIIMAAFAPGVDQRQRQGFERHFFSGKPTYVAEFEGLIVGFIVAEDRADSVYIGLLVVCPHFHGRTVGSRMLEWFIKEKKSQGHSRFALHCHRLEEVPQKLYRKHGFEVVDDDCPVIYNDGTVALRMELVNA
jgi:GNAT superfamily N-acetyltransferase